MARLMRGEKTKAVREYIASNPAASPKEIVAGVGAKGLKIKLSLANSIKYGKKTKSRRRMAPSLRAAARRTTSGAITVEQLLEIKKFADSVGGADHLRHALDMLEQLR